MIPIEESFPNKDQHKEEKWKKCGEKDNMRHIYTCDEYQDNTIEYENIFGEKGQKNKKIILEI